MGGTASSGLGTSLGESDDDGRVAVSQSASVATASDASSTTLLEANFDQQGFSDGFTLHVAVSKLTHYGAVKNYGTAGVQYSILPVKGYYSNVFGTESRCFHLCLSP